jgi:hypothetical protein
VAKFANSVLFTPTLGGTTDWTVSAAVQGFMTPAQAAAADGVYKYRAESGDLSQWEVGEGTYTGSGPTLTRTTVLQNSAGTTAKINFSTVPSVGIVALKQDILSIEEANGFTAAQKLQARTNIGILVTPQGRLTLASATPIMATTQSAKTTIYYALHVGNQIPIYDGTQLASTEFTELSVATTDTAKNPAAIGASKVNDWFVWNDAGVLRLSHGTDWTNDTTRAAALSSINGIWVNGTTITNGPAANRGTYVGTTRSDASSQLNWVLGAIGVAALLNVWNTYNRVPVSTAVSATALNWGYTSATVRQADASAACQISFVSGLAEEPINVDLSTQANMPSSASAFCQMGFAIDTTTAFDVFRDPVGIAASTLTMPAMPIKAYAAQFGYHFVSQNEAGDGTNSTTFFGNTKSALRLQTRM